MTYEKVMLDNEEFIENVKKLILERERFQKALANLTLIKEKLEDERDRLQKDLVQEGEERAKIFIVMADLKDKERARSRIIDVLTKRADEAEKRVKNLDAVLNRVQSEINEGFKEEPDPSSVELAEDLADQRQAEEDAALSSGIDRTLPAGIQFDEHEGDHGYDGPEFGVRGFSAERPPFSGILSNRFSRKILVRAGLIVVSGLALLLLLVHVLAEAGIYIDALRSLWQPWPPAPVNQAIGILVPLVSAIVWKILYGRGRGVSAPVSLPEEFDELEKQEPDETESEAYLSKVVDELFGSNNDEKN